MSQNFLHSDDTAAESRDIPQELSWQHRLYAFLRVFFPRFLGLARPERRGIAPLLGVSQDLSWWHRLYANLRAFLSRFLALVYKPKRFAPLVVDCCLLLQSTWSGRQLGPDLVYPMLNIGKRQSGRLARLILEHSRDQRLCEHHAQTAFPQGIDPPCVAVVDLGEVAQDSLENGYSTQVDTYGLTSMLILFETIVTLNLHVFYFWDQGWMAWINWFLGFALNLVYCGATVLRGEGTLMLARRSDTSTLGCAVLLDQDFTVVLNGSEGVIEALAESNFNLFYNPLLGFPLGGEERRRDSFYDTLEALCEGICLTVPILCWLLFRPSALVAKLVPVAVFPWIVASLSAPHRSSSNPITLWSSLIGSFYRCFPVVWYFGWHVQVSPKTPFGAIFWHLGMLFLYFFLLGLFSAGYRVRNYPIRSEKFLDALGHPRVRKWEFDTLAAAATFQCLVLCRGIDRPIKSIDIFAFLDMLVPDQRNVWKVWKKRVADRIVHEKDIFFAPTIPTFRDERQQQLKDLLDQAQFGNDAYRRFYDQGVPPDSTSRRTASLDEAPSSVFVVIWSTIRGFLSPASFADRFRFIP